MPSDFEQRMRRVAASDAATDAAAREARSAAVARAHAEKAPWRELEDELNDVARRIWDSMSADWKRSGAGKRRRLKRHTPPQPSLVVCIEVSPVSRCLIQAGRRVVWEEGTTTEWYENAWGTGASKQRWRAAELEEFLPNSPSVEQTRERVLDAMARFAIRAHLDV